MPAARLYREIITPEVRKEPWGRDEGLVHASRGGSKNIKGKCR